MLTIEQRKYRFIEKYINLKNLTTIEKLEKVLNEEVDLDGFILSDELKSAVDQGIKSLDSGKGIVHHEVISSMKQKYPTLKF